MYWIVTLIVGAVVGWLASPPAPAHAAVSSGIAPRLVTASTMTSASCRRASAAICSTGLRTPVDVSACTIATAS